LERPRRCGPPRIEALRATGVQAEIGLAFAARLGQDALVSRLQAAAARVLHHRKDLVLHNPKLGSHCSCRSMNHGSHVIRRTGQGQEST
jgi:hypothetical protein